MQFLYVSSAEQKAQYLDDFAQAVGLEVMREAYNAERLSGANRHVWVGSDPRTGATSVWGSLTFDVYEPCWWLSYGVWPRHQGCGLRSEMERYIVQTAFEVWSTKHFIRKGILVTNRAHYEQCRKETAYRNPRYFWHLAGTIWYPSPAYQVYVVTPQSWQTWKTQNDGDHLPDRITAEP